MSANSKSPPARPFHVGGRFWLSIGNAGVLGQERIALLESIAEQGSITRAAKALGISYKAAWDAVDAMNNLTPTPVVETTTGGRGGGGARLTDKGRRVIAAYRCIAAEYERFLSGINAALGDSGAAFDLLRGLALRTSARNRFLGRVAAVTLRPVDAEVEIAIQGEHRIRAGLTNESVDQLGLRPGRQVWALIKAVGVAIAPTPGEPQAGLNVLCGTVQRIARSDGPAEVVIALAGGATVRGVIAAERLERLGVVEQGRACAVFPAASVIVGVDN
jgi:molybdate transport system regulatory protein